MKKTTKRAGTGKTKKKAASKPAKKPAKRTPPKKPSYKKKVKVDVPNKNGQTQKRIPDTYDEPSRKLRTSVTRYVTALRVKEKAARTEKDRKQDVFDQMDVEGIEILDVDDQFQLLAKAQGRKLVLQKKPKKKKQKEELQTAGH